MNNNWEHLGTAGNVTPPPQPFMTSILNPAADGSNPMDVATTTTTPPGETQPPPTKDNSAKSTPAKGPSHLSSSPPPNQPTNLFPNEGSPAGKTVTFLSTVQQYVLCWFACNPEESETEVKSQSSLDTQNLTALSFSYETDHMFEDDKDVEEGQTAPLYPTDCFMEDVSSDKGRNESVKLELLSSSSTVDSDLLAERIASFRAQMGTTSNGTESNQIPLDHSEIQHTDEDDDPYGSNELPPDLWDLRDGTLDCSSVNDPQTSAPPFVSVLASVKYDHHPQQSNAFALPPCNEEFSDGERDANTAKASVLKKSTAWGGKAWETFNSVLSSSIILACSIVLLAGALLLLINRTNAEYMQEHDANMTFWDIEHDGNNTFWKNSIPPSQNFRYAVSVITLFSVSVGNGGGVC